MPSIETYRKQAKQLMRWHLEQNYSIGEKVRLIERFKHVTDVEALRSPLPLTLAQEIIAVQAGFNSWAELKASASNDPPPAATIDKDPKFRSVVPILFVADVAAAASFYKEKLGFTVDFLHGHPPFYGSVSRGQACIHLRFVHQTNFRNLAEQEDSLILASIEVANVKALFDEYKARDVAFSQPLVRQAWGGIDFHVRDPDGNAISFVEYRTP
jgi:uncharacterized glyoxalase superfamily protein PhnB